MALDEFRAKCRQDERDRVGAWLTAIYEAMEAGPKHEELDVLADQCMFLREAIQAALNQCNEAINLAKGHE